MNILSSRFRSRLSQSLVALLIGLAALSATCVNPFKPADPPPPSDGGIIEEFDTPEFLLDTMRQAIDLKSAGGANAWLHAFAESTTAGDRAYRSFYDPAVRDGWQSGSQQTAPEPWNIDLERNLYTQVANIRQNFLYSYEWGPDTFSPIDGDPAASDTVLFHRHYVLEARVSETDTDPDTIAIGYADLSLQKTAGRWSIFRWNDRVDPLVGVNPAETDQRTMSWWRLESLASR